MTTPTTSPRIRFNWGFHDAVADVREGRHVRDVSGHFDQHYACGYSRGVVWSCAGWDCSLSDSAWDSYVEWVSESNPTLAAELIEVDEVEAA